jgi:hypothetical protein
MKRLTKVYCLVRWDLSPNETGHGYIFIKREGNLVDCQCDPVEVKHTAKYMEVRCGKGTMRTSLIPHKVWEQLLDRDVPPTIKETTE